MALIACAGADVVRGRIHVPQRGAWFAELVLDTPKAPNGKVTIAAGGGLSLAGSVMQPSGVFLDAAHVRVVGGAGGLGKTVPPSAYQVALLRDPLNAVMSATGESLSSAVDGGLLATSLASWTINSCSGARAIAELCYAASQALGQPVGWRTLQDGTIWLGVESWPSQGLPQGAELLEQAPAEGRYIIGVDTPSLLPGVHLTDIDANVLAVDHWIEADRIRTIAWT